jgi:hypothetical protein
MHLPLTVLLVGLAQAAGTDGFTPLFNGKDLSGWKAVAKPNADGTPADLSSTWSVADGVLKCTGQPFGYLATEKEYGDYVLRVKWRLPAGAKAGNSGVLLHCGPKDEVWPVSVEAQMRAGLAGDMWLNTPPATTITVKDSQRDPKAVRLVHRLVAAEEKTFGEWNHYEITCRGGDITLVVNGKTVNEGKDCNLTRGRIALQAEGTEIHFKDVEIKSLK